MSNHSRASKEHGHDSVHDLGPYWKRAHRDWRFWIGVLFMSVALIVYVMTVDLSMTPRMSPAQPSPGAVSK
jgi:hypothetical protein